MFRLNLVLLLLNIDLIKQFDKIFTVVYFYRSAERVRLHTKQR